MKENIAYCMKYYDCKRCPKNKWCEELYKEEQKEKAQKKDKAVSI